MEEQISLALAGICCSMCILRYSGAKLSSFVKTSRGDQPFGEGGPGKRAKAHTDCVSCLGLLCLSNVDMVIDKAVECLRAASYDDPVFTTTLSVPICLAIRDYTLYLFLLRQIPEYSNRLPLDKLVLVKDVWKQLVGQAIAGRVQKRVDNGYFADLQVNVEMVYRGDRRESEIICRLPVPLNQRNQLSMSRVGAEAALASCDQLELMKVLPSSPLSPVHAPSFHVTCARVSMFLAGRYNKYGRDLYQTPWLLSGNSADRPGDNCDASDNVSSVTTSELSKHKQLSVLGLISEHITAVTRATEIKFSASGREDVDVRTLGRGRPFMLELLDARTSQLSRRDLRSLQHRINTACHGRVCIRQLQIVSRDSTGCLKQGEQEKTKVYTALVRCVNGNVSDRQLEQLQQVGGQQLHVRQQTPIRVLHRRPMAVRQRTVHWMRVNRVNERIFKLNLATQAGTYIKEFVHGDFGRTEPSLASLLPPSSADTEKLDSPVLDIIALDVDSVDLDWPPDVD